jgi:type II secretion system protein N
VSNRKSLLGYALFILVLTAACLYYRFPSDAVMGFLQEKAGQANPPLSLSAARLRPSLLLGLKMEKARVALKDAADKVLLEADSLFLRPALSLFLGGEAAGSFDAAAYNGEISGRVEVKGDEPSATVGTEILLSDISLKEHGHLSQFMEGTLGGTISFEGPSRGAAAGGSGEATLKIVDGKVNLPETFLILASIDFKEMDVELALEKSRINVTGIELRGSQMEGRVSGTILLKDEVANSSLNLKGTIKPFAAFFESFDGAQETVALFRQRLKQGSLSFVIGGTLKEPEVNFT